MRICLSKKIKYSFFIILIVVLTFFFSMNVYAKDTDYEYDELGRVIKVVWTAVKM